MALGLHPGTTAASPCWSTNRAPARLPAGIKEQLHDIPIDFTKVGQLDGGETSPAGPRCRK